jgi:hypothetical protein
MFFFVIWNKNHTVQIQSRSVFWIQTSLNLDFSLIRNLLIQCNQIIAQGKDDTKPTKSPYYTPNKRETTPNE